MGQHSHKPSLPNPPRRTTSPARRRWVTVAAGAAVVAAASTTAWAAVANDDPRASALEAEPSPSPSGSSAGSPGASPALSPTVSPTGPVGGPATGETSAPAGAKATPNTPAPSGTPVTAKSPSANPVATSQPKTDKKPAAKTKTKPSRVLASGRCGASFYAEGQMTANGERFNPSAMTAAHKTLPFGSRVRVTNPANGKSVTVRINDRGPFIGGRCLDLSRAAFAAIGNTGAGVMSVKYAVLSR